jgi:hypothetical protein
MHWHVGTTNSWREIKFGMNKILYPYYNAINISQEVMTSSMTIITYQQHKQILNYKIINQWSGSNIRVIEIRDATALIAAEQPTERDSALLSDSIAGEGANVSGYGVWAVGAGAGAGASVLLFWLLKPVNIYSV